MAGRVLGASHAIAYGTDASRVLSATVEFLVKVDNCTAAFPAKSIHALLFCH